MIRMYLPFLPPSVNAAYANIRGTNKRTLTTEGKAFKKQAAVLLMQKYSKELATLKPDVAYWLCVRLSMTNIYNKGWPTTAKTRHKTQDVSNRIKLLEDVLKDVSGIDDAQNMGVYAEKYQADEESTTIVIVTSEEPPNIAMSEIFDVRGV